MSRREKKSKINLKVWIPIICVLVVGITFYMLHDIQTKIGEMEQQNVIKQEENILGNTIENVVSENVVSTNETDNEVANQTQNTATNQASNASKNTTTYQPSGNSQPGITDKKQEAIELVKKEWGKDASVDYVFDYVNDRGEYVIAVKDRQTATVKNYFRVDLETKTVELDG